MSFERTAKNESKGPHPDCFANYERWREALTSHGDFTKMLLHCEYRVTEHFRFDNQEYSHCFMAPGFHRWDGTFVRPEPPDFRHVSERLRDEEVEKQKRAAEKSGQSFDPQRAMTRAYRDPSLFVPLCAQLSKKKKGVPYAANLDFQADYTEFKKQMRWLLKIDV